MQLNEHVNPTEATRLVSTPPDSAGAVRGLHWPLGGSRSEESSRRIRFSGKGECNKSQKKVWAGLLKSDLRELGQSLSSTKDNEEVDNLQ